MRYKKKRGYKKNILRLKIDLVAKGLGKYMQKEGTENLT